MILPGILSSQISGHLSTNSFESIATVTVGSGGAAYVEFTSIPSTYTHLQIREIGKLTAASEQAINLTFNSDTGANYSYHEIYAYGTGLGAAGSASQTSINSLYIVGQNSGTANMFNAGVLDILDYGNTNKYKTTRSLSGWDINGGQGYLLYRSGNWRSTSAITSLRLTPASGNWSEYSSIALYGVK